MDIIEEENALVKASPAGGADGEEYDRLIFPINAYQRVSSSGGLNSSDKKSMVVTAWIFVSAIILWVLMNVFRNVTTHYIALAVVVFVLIQLVIGSVILTYVFDLDSLNKEMDKTDSTFSQYFNISKAIIADEKNGLPCDLIEFPDGTTAAYVQLLLGYNTEALSQSTYEFNKSIDRILNKSWLHYRGITMTENFRNSDAAKHMLDVVKGVSDQKLFEQYRSIVQNLLDKSALESNVPVTIYMICAKTKIQKEELLPAIKRIIELADSTPTCYREVSTMRYNQIVQLYQDYNRLGVLDMGLARAKANKVKVSSRFPIMKIYGKNGVYSTPEYNKLQDEFLAEFGLTEAKGER